MYCPRIIDTYLSEWASRSAHKPLLIRGARQVGKSTAVRHLGERFESYVEINFERQSSFMALFQTGDLDAESLNLCRLGCYDFLFGGHLFRSLSTI